MIKQEIANYTRTYLAQGYNIQNIKNTLLTAGYSQTDIDDSISVVYRTPIKEKIIINKKKILFFTTLLIIFLITFFLVLKLSSMPGKPISFNLDTQLQKKALIKNENLKLYYTLRASGLKKDVKSIVNFKIVDYSNKQITQVEKEIFLKEEITQELVITLPTGMPLGNYLVQANARYKNFESKSALQFSIVSEAGAESGIKKEGEACTNVCNDNNICTEDKCIKGICQYTSITPCCGNEKCEAEENFETCNQDCKPPVTFRESIDKSILKAADTANKNPSESKIICQSLPTIEIVDRCFSIIASIINDAGLCTLMHSYEKKDLCYADISIKKKDFSLCQNIKDRWLRSSCVNYQRLQG